MQEYLETDSMADTSQSPYSNSTYLIVSKLAYLIGVPLKIFENEHEPPKMEIYEEMDKNKNARIIRNLCIIRTGIERNFGKVETLMRYELKNIDSIPDLIPPECAKTLWRDGVELLKANYKPAKYITDINKLINERINNCKSLFPIWLNWDYIRELFIMPDGMSERGARNAHKEYHARIMYYPYQVYINWNASESDGNILYSDKKLVSMLYEKHEDFFQDISKVTDASDLTKYGIYEFLEKSTRTVFVVDCENSDPYKLHAVLKSLEEDEIQKIAKIILYDGTYTTSAWQILNEFTEIPVQHIQTGRIKSNKSLVDMSLAVGVCTEFYEHKADSFVLVSSDSDYWALISMMPDVRFLVMVEENKCGYDIKQAMEDAGIFYCYIDDFYTGDSDDMKLKTILTQIRIRLDEALHLNIDEVLRDVYRDAMVDMSEGEKKQFYAKYIKPMRLVIAPDGEVHIQLGE